MFVLWDDNRIKDSNIKFEKRMIIIYLFVLFYLKSVV